MTVPAPVRRVFWLPDAFDLSQGFPAVTTKKLHPRSIIHELLWFISETNIAYLKENKVSIWDEWANENGDLGPAHAQGVTGEIRMEARAQFKSSSPN